MSVFNPVTLKWCGAEYTVPGDHVMGLVREIEGTITLDELSVRNGVPRGKLSKGYEVALNYAGCKNVTDEDIYVMMFIKKEAATTIESAIHGILSMMVPPDDVIEKVSKKWGQKPDTNS